MPTATTLMISLDKTILDPHSRAAARMGLYGLEKDIHILIPASMPVVVQVNERVRAEGIGGRKSRQFFRIVLRGRKILHDKDAGIDMITTQDPFFTGLAGFIIRTGKKISFEVQLHGDFYGSPYYKRGSLKHRIQYRLGRFILRRADRIRVPGERVRQSLLRLGVAPARIVVRPVALESEQIHAGASKPSQTDLHLIYPKHEKIFLVLARLDPVKNIPWLVDVFADVVRERPRYGLVIVGDGPDKGRIEIRIHRNHLEGHVHLEPWTMAPWDYLKTADALLFPSLSEGYGLVVMEAVAFGTPVIMTDVGVANYEVRSGSKVSIVPVGDAQKFVQAILKS